MVLPIEPVLPEVVATLGRGNLVLVAAPGAGKTTLIPPALLEAGLCDSGECWVLQPRRLAARLAATHVARRLGEAVGNRCGYQVRFDSAVSAATRIRYVTEGLLTRRMRDDPDLTGIDTVVLDEFHERHLESDIALALLRRLRSRRPELRIAAMSATMQPEPLAVFLDAPVIRVEGRAYPVEVEYAPDSNRALASRVARALRSVIDDEDAGHILVFLPGAREIADCVESCQALARAAGISTHALHGELPRDAQDAAVSPSPQRRLILATNVAETSITIEGVATVIDSGMARIAAHDPWSGVHRLSLSPISRASADQRAGRAGRTRPGRCIRLYARHDLERRSAFDSPEVERLELSGAVLDLLAAGAPSVEAFEWYEAPPAAALSAATELLRLLSAIDDSGLTPTGRAMLRFPLHPRLARLMVEAQALGVAGLGAGAAALLSERPLRRSFEPADRDADADVLVELDWLDRDARGENVSSRYGLDARTLTRAGRVRRQLLRIANRDAPAPPGRVEQEDALRKALLASHPDRVAKVRDDGPHERTLVMSTGGAAKLSPASVVRTAKWVVGLTIEQRSAVGRQGITRVRSAAAIEPEWLVDLFAESVEDSTNLRFDDKRQRVVGWSELRYGQLVLEASEMVKLPATASRLLADAAAAAGFEHFVPDPEAVEQLLFRSRLVHAHSLDCPALTRADADELLRQLCAGKTSFEEIRTATPLARLRLLLGDFAHRIDGMVPTELRLPGGRRVRVNYESDRPPWIASRLQDFFGLRTGPSILEGRVPLVLHLRAPNNRDVQVTTDLSGFWDNHYPGLRKSLMRRYPRHDWPENPRDAKPPAPRGRRPRA